MNPTSEPGSTKTDLSQPPQAKTPVSRISAGANLKRVQELLSSNSDFQARVDVVEILSAMITHHGDGAEKQLAKAQTLIENFPTDVAKDSGLTDMWEPIVLKESKLSATERLKAALDLHDEDKGVGPIGRANEILDRRMEEAGFVGKEIYAAHKVAGGEYSLA